MRTLLGQIQDAFERSGMSLAELHRRSGWPLDVSNLSRRMDGSVPLRTGEAEALATALGITLTWNARRAARRAA